MKAYVITIENHKGSNDCADRLIKSGNADRFGSGLWIHKFKATTPTNIHQIFENEGLNPSAFQDKYSIQENAMACFYSHYSLWKKTVEEDEPHMIFEHDAVIVGDIPNIFTLPDKGCISFGKPSYGKYNIPTQIGINPLQSKQYFPGAHAYLVRPHCAKQLIQKAKTHAAPTDLFLTNANFNFLEEYYPWPVEVKDTFTTIQQENGCIAKHNYNKNYRIDTNWDNLNAGQDFK